MKTITFIINNLDSYKFRFWVVVIAGFFDGILLFTIPILLSEFTKSDFTNSDFYNLVPYIILCVIGSIILQWKIRKSGESLAFQYSNHLKLKYFKKIAKLKTKTLSNHHSGYLLSLVNKVSDGSTQIMFSLIWALTHSTATLILFFIFTVKESVLIAIVNLSILIIFLTLSIFLSKQMVPIADKLNKLTAILIERFVDLMSNVFTIKKLGIFQFAEKQLKDKIDLNDIQIQKLQTFHANRWMFLHSIYGIAFLSTIIFLLYKISNGSTQASILILFIAAFSTIRGHIEQLSEMIKGLLEMNAYIDTLDQILIQEEPQSEKSILKWNNISLTNIEFSYSNSTTLIKIPNFEFKKGDIISIIGESGQGKSTFIDIFTGFLEIENGDFNINNEIILDSSKDKIRNLVSMVTQEIDLFNMNIRDNIALGKDISDTEIINILKKLNLNNWYKLLPDGLNTTVGEKGVKLSAGQKQRLSIARAFLMDREIIILDEPTSHLDKETEEIVVQFIKDNLVGKSAIFVTHKDKIKSLCNRNYKFERNTLHKINYSKPNK